jgi:hypothetical protein
LWHRVIWDADEQHGVKHRFGLLVFILGAWALAASRGVGAVRAGGVVLLVQLLMWTGTTHLYARFAVPMLIPLVMLISGLPLVSLAARRVAVVMVVAGTLANLVFAGRLYLDHMCPQGQRLNLEGATAFFTDGLGLGHEHLAVINRELPSEAHILMIGDAKAFYFRRPVEYCVVFNRSPLVTMLEVGSSPAEVVAWLTERGYTHLLVNWSEIARLRGSRYGFPGVVNRAVVGRLASGGLVRTHEFISNATGGPYAELYEGKELP